MTASLDGLESPSSAGPANVMGIASRNNAKKINLPFIVLNSPIERTSSRGSVTTFALSASIMPARSQHPQACWVSLPRQRVELKHRIAAENAFPAWRRPDGDPLGLGE